MHSVPHAIGLEGLEDGALDFVSRRHFGERHGMGGVEQAVEMVVEIGDPSVVDPQALPHRIAALDRAVEDGYLRFAARLQFTANVDQDIGVTGIGKLGGHGRNPYSNLGFRP